VRATDSLHPFLLGALAGVVVCAIVAAGAHFAFGLTFDDDDDRNRVTIPGDVIGEPFDRARGRLQALGLDNVKTPGSSYYLGVPSKITDVVPSPGTQVEPDTTVTLLPVKKPPKK
jgi:hypothetical protein